MEGYEVGQTRQGRKEGRMDGRIGQDREGKVRRTDKGSVTGSRQDQGKVGEK
jgi:hypothetical protein